VSHFLSPATNRRGDEYGGSLTNRLRLLREMIVETQEAVGERCAVAVRFAIDDDGSDETAIRNEERREMFAALAELPDLWDLNIQDYSWEMGHSRFVPEGGLEDRLAFAKSVTRKPVVAVGRFTSPDAMVAQLRRGVLDLIGAARPSISDPFLPKKIEEGRLDDIRECIGCNICYASNSRGVPIRCTQNPTMGEEWRRGWHPEVIAPRASAEPVLVVGGGPAGLEAARALGQRG
jgi:dimethylamine/trimethylamine dehydrogenase